MGSGRVAIRIEQTIMDLSKCVAKLGGFGGYWQGEMGFELRYE